MQTEERKLNAHVTCMLNVCLERLLEFYDNLALEVIKVICLSGVGIMVR